MSGNIEFVILFASTILWLFLCHKTFKILKNKHPEKHKEMGCPGLFSNNNFKTNYTFLKYLFKREYKHLNDKELNQLGNFMLPLFICVLIGLFTLQSSIVFRSQP